MSNKPEFYHGSDYCGLKAKNAFFYYGYEVSKCVECGNINDGEYCDSCEDAESEWCFEANIEGIDNKIIIPYSRLGVDGDMFDVVECLGAGIGWVLAKYKLVIE